MKKPDSVKYKHKNGEYKFLLYEKLGSIVKITFNRPKEKNAFSLELYSEVKWALVEAQMDSESQVVILTGAGDSFGSGGDLKEVLGYHTSKKGWIGAQLFMEASSGLFRQIAEHDKIIISMVNGPALAAGLVVCEYSDIVIASEKAWFQSASALVGIADSYSSVRLPSLVGLARAKYILLSGARIDAYEAEKWGLVVKVVPHDQLWPSTLEVANQVMQTGPNLKKIIKHIVHGTLPKIISKPVFDTIMSEECFRGVDAFAHKRKPKWAPQGK